MYPKLKALDGYRKAVGDCINMKEALPQIQDDNIKYEVEQVEWYDQDALSVENPAKGRFEDTIETRKDENSLLALIGDCKTLLQRKATI